MSRQRRSSNSSMLSRVSHGSITRPRTSFEHSGPSSQRLRRSSRIAERIALDIDEPQVPTQITNTKPDSVNWQPPDAIDSPERQSDFNLHQGELAVDQTKEVNEASYQTAIMAVILQPVKVKTGVKFDAPLVVSLNKDKNPTELMSVLSVVSEDGRTAIAPPAPDVIAGNTSGSLQILDHGQDKEEAVHLFRDLRLRRPGKYRLRVSMMRRERESYVNVQSVVSKVITVDDKSTNQITAAEKDMLQELKGRGMRA